MKRHIFLPVVLFIIATLATRSSHAQYSPDKIDKDELYVSGGFVTVEEINGWDGKGGFSGYVSMPNHFSGAWFATYRHYFTKRFAAGITAGLDNESGELSYGDPEHYRNITGLSGTSGFYNVKTYTVALEALFAYYRNNWVTVYGYAGAGATMYEDVYTIYKNAPYGSPVPIPSNPYDYKTTYFNARVAPIGVRFGGHIAGFAEFGFGYKGLISAGLSIRM